MPQAQTNIRKGVIEVKLRTLVRQKIDALKDQITMKIQLKRWAFDKWLVYFRERHPRIRISTPRIKP